MDEKKQDESVVTNKSEKIKKTLKIILLLLFFGATFYTVYAVSKTLSGGSIASFYEVISSINPTFALILAALVVWIIFSDSLKYAVLSKIISGRFDFVLSLRVGIMGRFYDNITPFNTGGQVYQIYQYNKAEYPPPVAAAIPIIKYAFQLIAWIAVSVVLYIVNHSALDYLPSAQATVVGALTYAGISIASLAPILVILFSLFPKPVEKVISFFLKIGVKIKLLKDFDKAYEKIVAFFEGYKRAFIYIAKNFIGNLVLFIICCIDFLLVMSVPFFVVMALGKTTPDMQLFWDIVTLNAYSLFAASLVPTPGNSGAIEGVAAMAFAPIPMTEGGLFWLVFIWRFCTYYIYIVLGLFGTAYNFIANCIKKRRLQKINATKKSRNGMYPPPCKIRVLEVLDNFFPTIDGVVNVVDNYARILNKNHGDELVCDVLVPRYPSYTPPQDIGYNIIYTTSVSGGKYGVRLPLPQFDLKLKRYLRKNRYDIVHCHSPVTLSKTALKYCKKYDIPIVFTVHTMYHEEINRSVKLKSIQRFALNFLLSSIKKTDYLWATTEKCKQNIKDIYKIDMPCEVMENGTDLTDADEAKTSAIVEELKKKHRLSEDEKVLLFAGRLVVVKNITLAISACAVLKERDIKFKFLIVGDGDYKDKLMEETEKLGLTDCIEFAGNVTDRETLAAYYRIADLFMMPSTFDTAPLSTRESEAMGTPCVMIKDSSAAENIIDCENGFLAENTAEDWADKIEFAINNPETYQKVSENCKNLALSWSQIMDKVWEKYKEIIILGKRDNKFITEENKNDDVT